MLTSVSEAVSVVALYPAAPVEVDGADNKADSFGIIDVAHVMINNVAIVDCTNTRVAIEDGSVDAVVIVVVNSNVLLSKSIYKICIQFCIKCLMLSCTVINSAKSTESSSFEVISIITIIIIKLYVTDYIILMHKMCIDFA